MAGEIQQSKDLWDLEHYLTQRLKQIDRRYDSRSSRLIDVSGRQETSPVPIICELASAN